MDNLLEELMLATIGKRNNTLTALQLDVSKDGVEIKIDRPLFEELGKSDQARFMSAVEAIVILLHKAVTGETITDADLQEGRVADRKCKECDKCGKEASKKH